jgi:undecaprenyl-diphosphatase
MSSNPPVIPAPARDWFRRVDRAEERLCMRLNRGCHRPQVRALFKTVSRLGDGILWYLLMLALPMMAGELGARVALQMAVAGVAGLLLYRALKHRLVRERPFITHAGILLGTAPLDRYSFPSGHTLHAVCFTLVAVSAFPVLGWVLVPFAAAVAASRVVLGLHYPTDVLAGAVIGAGLAGLVKVVLPAM